MHDERPSTHSTESPFYRTLPSLWQRYETLPRQLAFRARTREEWKTWRHVLQAKVSELLGGFPAEPVALDATLLESHQEDGYRLEKVAFQSEPGLYIPCYVLTPDHGEPPYRPVIAVHGHGTGGAAYVIGRVLDEETRTSEEALIQTQNHDYGRQLARHGFMVFVPVQRGLGERLETEPWTIKWEGASQSSCRPLAFNAMLLGKTLLGLRVWDLMRTVDYIRNRPEPMVPGLGCVGFSGGGTTTLFAAALDSRITVPVVSGYFNTFRDSIMAMVHCECNYVPHILKYAEMYDVAGLIAPRPLLVESGTQDGIFPSTATEAAYRELQKIYTFLGVPEHLDKDIFDGGHQFSGIKAFDWLHRWLEQSPAPC
jgi:dienelactone hydrolase